MVDAAAIMKPTFYRPHIFQSDCTIEMSELKYTRIQGALRKVRAIKLRRWSHNEDSLSPDLHTTLRQFTNYALECLWEISERGFEEINIPHWRHSTFIKIVLKLKEYYFCHEQVIDKTLTRAIKLKQLVAWQSVMTMSQIL